MLRIASYILLTISLIATALFVSLTPDLLPKGVYTDKVLHVFIFTIAVILPSIMEKPAAFMLRYCLALLVLGAGVELLQYFSSTRTAELYDLIANGIGICLGFFIGTLLRCGFYAGEP